MFRPAAAGLDRHHLAFHRLEAPGQLTLPAQQLVLRLEDRSVRLGSDGLAPFAVISEDGDAAPR